MLIDTHAHLDYPDFADDLPGVISRALEHGVQKIVSIGTGLESSARAVALANAHAGVYAVIGVHPTNVGEEIEDFLPGLRELAANRKVVAIGETGLDYHDLPGSDPAPSPALAALGAGSAEATHAELINGAYKAAQMDAFRMQLDLAVELGLNVVIHQRDAWADTLEILRPYTGKLRGVFHCFGGTPEMAAEIRELGHLVSFTGIVTFKNATQVQQSAAAVPADGYMVETDCPYLAPAPHRGKRCEPWHTALIASQIAGLRNISAAQVAGETSATAEAFFGFSRNR
ncbi:MAG: TatD family hydrolase [Terrimicrobiaceae bacterium]